MSPAFNPIEFYSDAHGALPGGSPWLQAYRAAAMTAFAARGFPSLRDENWKYTSLRKLSRRGYAPAVAPAVAPADADRLLADVATVELVDGLPVALPVTDGDLYVASLRDALEGPYVTAIETALTAFSEREGSALRPLNSALLRDAVVIRMPAGRQQPTLYLRHSHSDNAAGERLANNRVLIIAEADSEATVVEHHVGGGAGKRFTNCITEVALAAGARLDYCKLTAETDATTHVAGLQFSLARDTRLRAWNFDLGGGLVRHDHLVELHEPGAEVELNGLFLLDGRQHVDNHTRIDHFASHTTSRELYRGVLDDRSRGVFNGKAVIHRQAQKVSAQQTSNNLLLSAAAEIDTKPELEIYADDITASHGATVGQLDNDALFYLRARGVAEPTARALLIYAFANEIVATVPEPGLREALRSRVLRKLPAKDELGGLL